jgi:hypothetical protein
VTNRIMLRRDMKKRSIIGLVVLAPLSFLLLQSTKNVVAAAQTPHEPAPLQLIQRIPLAGVSGRIHHFSPNPNSDIVILAALGNDSVEIVKCVQRQVRSKSEGIVRTSRRALCAEIRPDCCGERSKRYRQGV